MLTGAYVYATLAEFSELGLLSAFVRPQGSADQRDAWQYVKDCLTFVSELGGRIVTVVPSTVGKTVPMASELSTAEKSSTSVPDGSRLSRPA